VLLFLGTFLLLIISFTASFSTQAGCPENSYSEAIKEAQELISTDNSFNKVAYDLSDSSLSIAAWEF